MTSVLRDLVSKATEIEPGYVVTRDGEIWSLASNWRGYGPRELTPFPDSDGYPTVRINGKKVRVHRKVAEAYLPPPPPGHQVRHLNGDKEDNRVENLAWGTAKDNADDRDVHGRAPKGERNGFSKLKDADVRDIRMRLAGGELQADIARSYGVTRQAISSINCGGWGHVG